MFLLLGALTLQGLPGALLAKSPPWQMKECALEAMPLKAKPSQQTMGVERAKITERELVRVDGKLPLSPDAAILQGQAPPSYPHHQQVTLISYNHQLDSKTSAMSKDTTLYSEQPPPHGQKAMPKPSSSQFRGMTAQLRSTLKVFTAPMFYLNSLSLATQVFTMTTFFQVYVDLAQDKGIEAHQAIYMMHAYSIADFVFRVVGGIVVDRRYVRLEMVVLMSFLGCIVACEAVAWSTSLVHLLLSSLVYGASAAIVLSLAPSIIINDFKGHPIPVVLGGMMFVTGLALLTRPVLVGKFASSLARNMAVSTCFSKQNPSCRVGCRVVRRAL